MGDLQGPASPTIIATGTVPGLRPRCCPPPNNIGGNFTPRRTRSSPIPPGPPNLWPLAASVATPNS